MFQFVETHGDIFVNCPPTVALAHCVSLDFKMSQGIALAFRQKFGQIHSLRHQVRIVGQCAVVGHESRWVFYMVTKLRYFMKPSYHSVEQALRSMKQHMERLHIKELAVPGRLSCGRDKLNWDKVRQIIYKVFWDSTITIYAYHL